MSLLMTELPGYCPDKSKAEQNTMAVKIYRQCEDPITTLIASISPGDMDGSGSAISMQIASTYTQIITSNSTAPSANTFASRPPTINVPLLIGATQIKWDEIISGKTAEDSDLNTNYKQINWGDDVGVEVPRYYCEFSFYSSAASTSADRIFIAPNCEIMSADAMTFGAGKNVIRVLQFMPMPVSENWSGWNGEKVQGGRMVELFRKSAIA